MDTHTAHAPGAGEAEAHLAHPAHDHPHHVASFKSLAGVLTALLVLTALTVYSSQSFHWLGEGGHFILAMVIALAKSLMVAAIFMHLLHDKVLNSVVMFFCLFAVGCFLSFTMLDMMSRGRVDPLRAGLIGPPPLAAERVADAIAAAGGAHGAEGVPHAAPAESPADELAPPAAGDH